MHAEQVVSLLTIEPGLGCIDMVKDFWHWKLLVITIITIVLGRSCKNLYPFASTLWAMSRCYPYPPPGYEKKAQAELGLTHKREKHKHKEKKKKRKRDDEVNGESRNSNKKLNKSHHAHSASELPCEKDESKAKAKDVCPTPSACPIPKIHAVDSSASIEWSLDGGLHAAGGTNGTAIANNSHAAGDENDSLKRKDNTLSPHLSMETWSTGDALEWLFVTQNQLHSKPMEERRGKTKMDEDLLVWDEAMFLPSSGIYALPYVVPY